MPPSTNWSWYHENGYLYLFSNKIPHAKYNFVYIAFIDVGMKWTWQWEDNNNILDRRLYPKGLRKTLYSNKEYRPALLYKGEGTMLSGNDVRIMCSLHAMKGIWYAYLVDKTGVNVVILTKLIKKY